MATGRLSSKLGRPTCYCTVTLPQLQAYNNRYNRDGYAIILAMALLSVSEAAARTSLSGSRIRKALADGQIRGARLETFWLIEEQSLDEFMASPRKPGRPTGWRKPKGA